MVKKLAQGPAIMSVAKPGTESRGPIHRCPASCIGIDTSMKQESSLAILV